MKYIVFLIFFLSNIVAAELILNRYEEANQSVDIYHVVDDDPLRCSVRYGKNFKKIIKCEFKKSLRLDRSFRDEKYFKIEVKDNEVIFYSKSFVKLLPVNDEIIAKDTIKKIDSYRHWVVLGSLKKPKILDEKAKKVFNFPLQYKKESPPFIGPLDLNGEPIKKKKDAITLSHIKKLYKRKKYRQIIKLSDELKRQNITVFTNEIALYKIRSLAKIAPENRELYYDLKIAALEWINDNPSNRHIPEAYMYVAIGSFGLGRVKQGEKYLKILSDGFAGNKFTQLAKLSYANTLYKTKKRRPNAIRIFKKVLYETEDVYTASLASIYLANAYLDKKEPKKAHEIFEKVLKSNKSFIPQNPQKSYNLAKKFANHLVYDTPLEIAKLLEKEKDKIMDEELLKNIANWEQKNGDIEDAIRDYSLYVKKFPEGKFINFVKSELDSIMIDKNDTNLTKKLAFIDDLLRKYDDKNIRKKALKRKIEILNTLKRYDEIVAMKNELISEGLQKELNNAVKNAAISNLLKKRCQKAMLLADEYNLTFEPKYDEPRFKCLMQNGRYEKALDIARSRINTDDLNQKLKWLYMSVALYKKMDRDKEVILAANDLLKLSKTLGVDKYDDVLYDIAEAYYNLKEYDGLMLKTVMQIEKKFPDNIKNIDLFMKVLRYAQKTKKDMLVINFAKKIINLQKKYNISSYSPKVEITLVHALQKGGKYKEALREVLKLLTKKLSDKQKAQALYLAGEISVSLKKTENAKEFFLKCGEIVKDSSWQKLCAQNLELLNQ